MSTKPQREKAGAAVVGWMLLGLAVLIGGAYLAAYLAAGDKVPRGTSVAGIDVGGLTHEEAAEALETGLSPRAETPLVVSVDGTESDVLPADAGLSVDYRGSVDQVGAERSWDPQWLWSYFTGGTDHDPVVVVDEATRAAFLAEVASGAAEPVTEGAVRFGRGDFSVTKAASGRALDPVAAAAALEAAFLADDGSDGATVAELPLVAVQPEIDEHDVADAIESFADPAVSGPVTLVFGQSRVKVSPTAYTRALALVPQDGVLVPQLDQRRLERVLAGQVSGGGAPQDARIELVDGRPQVIPAKPGVTFEPEDVHAVFLDLVAAPAGEREAEVGSTVAKPAFTTKEAKALAVSERVSTFTTYFPYAEYRNVNIPRAAELIDGTLLKPGETFSLNGTVGERTEENGFVEGFIISDGVFKQELGGGVSQVATTTFNAAFFAGLEDVEHKPHSFFIDRYPPGREATVAWPTVDLRFRNDTPYGVLIDTSSVDSTPSSSGSVTVTMWSTPWWDVTSTTGPRHNLTSPGTRILRTEDCYPNEGYGGFDIDVVRRFAPVGDNTEQRSPETFHTTYTPSDTVICKPPNSR